MRPILTVEFHAKDRDAEIVEESVALHSPEEFFEFVVARVVTRCGEEMEKGYLISKMGVYWDDHVPRFIAPGTLLSPNTTEVFKMHHVPSFRCQSCKIIQYGEPSDFVRLECPHCKAKYEYEIPKDTDQIVCQNCAKTFSRVDTR